MVDNRRRSVILVLSLLSILVALVSSTGLSNSEERMLTEFNRRLRMLRPSHYSVTPLQLYGYSILGRGARSLETVTAMTVGGDYQLGPGDQLLVTIYGNIYDEHTVVLDREGSVSIPAVGSISLSPATLDDAREIISDHLLQLYSGIRVRVSLGRLRDISLYVVGEVANPGVHTVSSLATPLEALVEAGGVTGLGSLRRVYLLRDGHTLQELDAYDFLLEGVRRSEVNLRSGDVILVPPHGPRVAIAGEVLRPAVYEITEGSTLSNLIKMAGGLTELASLADIRIERPAVAGSRSHLQLLSIDDYEVFAGSDQDLALISGDLIFVDTVKEFRVPDRTGFVSVSGNVPRPGDYRLYEGMTVSSLLEKAGGPLSETIMDRAEIWRYVSDQTRVIIAVNLQGALESGSVYDLPLEEWDIVQIYSVKDVLPEDTVRVSGAVNEPGVFELEPEMTLRDALFRAAEPRRDAYLGRAHLYRLREGALREVITVDLSQILSNEYDIPLRPKDVVMVHTVEFAIPQRYVAVSGEVRDPGTYELHQDMKVSDLLFAAGGPTDKGFLGAVEVYRSYVGRDEPAQVFYIDLSGLDEDDPLSYTDSPADMVLQPGDAVSVRALDTDRAIRLVRISGEVRYPGEYRLLPGERLSSVVARAGGLSSNAYPFGAVYTRESLKRSQESVIHRLAAVQRQQIEEERARVAELPLTSQQREERLLSLEYQSRVLDLMLSRVPEGRIIFSLEAALRGEDPADDLLVHSGDRLFVPATPQVVMVVGDVYNPESVLYRPGEDVEYYLNRVGGLTNTADSDGIYVIKADGSVQTQRTGIGQVNQGDILVVPHRMEQGGGGGVVRP